MSKYLISSVGTNHIQNCYPPSTAQAGQPWWDSGQQCLTVYNGTDWVPVHEPSVAMTFIAEEAIDRMVDMISNQSTIADMADKYPLVRDALCQLEVALKMCQNLDDNE